MSDSHLKEEYEYAIVLSKEMYPNEENQQKLFLEGFRKDQVKTHGRSVKLE